MAQKPRSKEQAPIARGLGEVSQDAIEKRALELAKAAGRSTMDAADLAEAHKEILGGAPVSERSSTGAASEQSAKE